MMIFAVVATILFTIILALWFFQLRTAYFRILFCLQKAELRSISPVESPSIGQVGRMAIFLRGHDTGIIIYELNGMPLYLQDGSATFVGASKGNLVFRSRIQGGISQTFQAVAAQVLAENTWVPAGNLESVLMPNNSLKVDAEDGPVRNLGNNRRAP